ncbi:alpha-glucuronidase [Paenibacillus glycanilyticus]|uniref:alpha-glucuronidase family glycosyl hydrolase n=1 Tax=Paenibacillus glycanilyticus TaxID=126569 RepID=UPI002040EB0C|nr:alpha-glucuronidase family glycosyl hydrolase [Paenibacillus glycanilyticus]MCM3628897.1 alpha-glucuronidase [Paenibacillus glycanilyticus]
MRDNGYAAWLRYDQVTDEKLAEEYKSWTSELVLPPGVPAAGLLKTAAQELSRGIRSMLGTMPSVTHEASSQRVIVLDILGRGTWLDEAAGDAKALSGEGYVLRTVRDAEREYIIAAGRTEKGTLYAAFHVLRLLQSGASVDQLDLIESPTYGLRMINHWDNMDGSVERGYSGRSIFYEGNKVLSDSERIRDYARLMASVGINGIAINNVNVHREETFLITGKLLPDVARIAEVFGEYGIKLFLSVNYAGTIEIGGLTTADPLDPGVRDWWKEKAAEVYRYIPDFGGFLVKADSENRPGPFTYGRDHADGANMLAEALEPHGGLVLWRCFVYNCHQDWRDRSTDRARAAYDHFKPLDGRFKDNVILQIKNGPMDFQVREPVSPLFGAMEHTNQIMEFQIAQEYTGQQKDVCFLIPQWKEVLNFDTHVKGAGSTVKEIAAGHVHAYTHSGITAVSNIGNDGNWTGHHLAQANLYGYGRLIWNPELSSEEIAAEWAAQTFGGNQYVREVVISLLLESWSIYENYTAPLGVGWMVTPHYHYGPDVDGYEYSKWGTYHFADHKGIGVDRTVATGTGYSSQYTQPNAEVYDNLDACPDELLLFFHHVPYTHRLKSGKTVIQHIYDTHFAGVERVEYWIRRWQELEGLVDEERFRHVAGRMNHQLENAKQWRDIINTYFFRKSGIPDAHNRVIY